MKVSGKAGEGPRPACEGTGNLPHGAREPHWFDAAFDLDYLMIYRHRDEAAARRETAFAVASLGLEQNARVLDLACGAGRHLSALGGRGFVLSGLDRSKTLLDCARAGLPPNVRLVRGDMRRLPFRAKAFDAVLNFFTSFGYFSTDEENEAVLAELARVLRPKGSFLLDLMDKKSVCARLQAESVRSEGQWTVRERRALSADGTRIEKEITVHSAAGSTPCAERTVRESVRVYEQEEITAALARAGLAVTHTRGDFDAAPYRSQGTARMILTGRRV